MSLLDQLQWSLRHSKRQLFESILVVMAIALGVGVIITVLGMLLAVEDQLGDLENAEHFRTLEIMDKTEAAMRQGAPLTLLGSDLESASWSVSLDEIAVLQKQLPPSMHPYIQMGWSVTTPLLPEDEESDETMYFWFDSNQIYITGTLPQYFAFQGQDLQQGTFFLPEDVEYENKVLVITAGLAQDLFREQDPVGQQIPLTLQGTEETILYTIIGVLAPPDEEQGFYSFIEGRTAYAPITAYPFYRGEETRFSNVFIGIDPGVDIFSALERAQNEVGLIWGERVAVRSSLAEFRESQKQIQRFALLIGILASVGLVIAVINILNLMLARVLKRTKSIGLSIALGSSRGLVFRQFMMEAFSLGMLGSVLGIILSFGLARILKGILGDLIVGMLGTRIALGIVIGFGVSLFFGVYPAYLGSRINPVDALRTD
ncbi:MAG: FtsX-like permease family protein [Firmicutes bacterium]|mgnify:CR=1 FL=1|nr:FtsX-like permease family protein [Bacillota bacterium]